MHLASASAHTAPGPRRSGRSGSCQSLGARLLQRLHHLHRDGIIRCARGRAPAAGVPRGATPLGGPAVREASRVA